MERNNENSNSKIYFIPGDLVIIKHELDNKPIMLVVEVVTSRINIPSVSTWVEPDYRSAASFRQNTLKQTNAFKGIRCGWFDHSQVWHE